MGAEGSRAPRRAAPLAAILAVAASVRLAHWWAVRDAPFIARLIGDSAEYVRWAAQIESSGSWLGEGAFFQAPLYPYLLAALFRVVGVSLDAVYLVQIGLAVAGCWALYRAGSLLLGRSAGLAAALLAAVYGPFVFHDVLVLKESLAVTTVCFLLWSLAIATSRGGAGAASPPGGEGRGEGDRGLLPWLLSGLLLGVLVLLRENALLTLPFLLLLARPWRGGRRAVGRCAALLLGLALALAPLALRNRLVTGSWTLTTFQGGANLWIGNNPEADGTYRSLVAGWQEPAKERQAAVLLAERATGRQLSPREVSRYWAGEVGRWALREPGAFLRLQLHKLRLFWTFYEWPDVVDYAWFRSRSPLLGLPLLQLGGAVLLAAVGLWSGRERLGALVVPGVWVVAWTVATIAFFLFSRYRLPMVPALLLVAALPPAALAESVARRRWRPALALGGVTLAAFLLPWAGHPPRLDLVHYNLGKLAADEGDLEQAGDEYLRALAVNPGMVGAATSYGMVKMKLGEPETALPWLQGAVRLAPGSGRAWTNLGVCLLQLGAVPEGRAALKRAIALEPTALEALHNLAVLAAREGRLETARGLNRRALAIDPGFPPALRLEERLATEDRGRGR